MQSFRRYPFERPSKKRRGVKNCKCKVKFKAAQRSTRTVATFPSSWSEDRFFCILRALPHKNCCNLLKFVATLGRLVTETEMLLPKGKSFESVLQNSNPTKRKYPVRFISGGKYVKC